MGKALIVPNTIKCFHNRNGSLQNSFRHVGLDQPFRFKFLRTLTDEAVKRFLSIGRDTVLGSQTSEPILRHRGSPVLLPHA